MKFANFIGEINSRIILSLVFIFLIGIYSIVKKALNFIFLRKQTKNTFWEEKKYRDPSIENLRQQF